MSGVQFNEDSGCFEVAEADVGVVVEAFAAATVVACGQVDVGDDAFGGLVRTDFLVVVGEFDDEPSQVGLVAGTVDVDARHWSRVTGFGGRDPVGASSGSNRVLRGGSWYNDAVYCRSEYRLYSSPDFRDFDLGFRLAAVPE